MTKKKHNPLSSALDGNYVQLVREMDAASRQLDALPEDQEWTQEQLGILEDVRHAAVVLSMSAETTIRVFEEGNLS